MIKKLTALLFILSLIFSSFCPYASALDVTTSGSSDVTEKESKSLNISTAALFNENAVSFKGFGDLDSDGKITALDVQCFITGLARGITIEEDADVNVDGKINFLDLNILMRAIHNSRKASQIRIVKDFTKVHTDDGGFFWVYNVFNPTMGTVETGIKGTISDDLQKYEIGDIVGLTTNGYIDNSVVAAGNAFVAGNIYNVDSNTKFENTTGLGYAEIAEYDETTGYLFLDNDDAIYQVTDETVVTFLDKSAQTISVVNSAVLGSTSKTYRWDSKSAKEQNLTAFVCVEVDDDADEDLGDFYNVKFAVIVRD